MYCTLKMSSKKKKGTKRTGANALIQSCSSEEIKEIFDMIVHHGRINHDEGVSPPSGREPWSFSANDIAEASIHVGTTIDTDLAHAMIEYVREYCTPAADNADVVTQRDFDKLLEILSNNNNNNKE